MSELLPSRSEADGRAALLADLQEAMDQMDATGYGAMLGTLLHRCVSALRSESGAMRKETREETRQRFEAWHKVTYPLFNPDRDSTLKHALWTAWQVANGI